MSTSAESRLAIHGGSPIRGPDKTWPAWPIIDERERNALIDVLESGQWWYGPNVARFEKEFAAFQGAEYCVSCSSGSTALEICLQALGIKPGDEVIVPAYTFIATAGSVLRMGGTSVIVDIDASWCLNPGLLEEAITPRSRAIIPVHFGGRMADMDRINAIADHHNLTVIEDACHAWGSQWRGRGAGTLGLCGVFSFQASKNMSAGEGGAIITNSEEFAETCRSITNTGRLKDAPGFNSDYIGTNARITEFTAALLSAQLTRLEDQTRLRERNAAILDKGLGPIEGLYRQQGAGEITRRAYHLYCFDFDAGLFGCSRDRFMEAAHAEGLPLRPGYDQALNKQPVFIKLLPEQRYEQSTCPVAEELCSRGAVWLDHWLLLGTEEDMGDIVAIITKLKEHVSELAD